MLLGETNRRTYSLQELTSQVRSSLLECFPETYWVRAETSDVRINASSGHCYLEFVEKNRLTCLTLKDEAYPSQKQRLLFGQRLSGC